ncbi:MAG: glycosyltransferase family 2 protein [Candidatus Aenigmatarchaeota archaeon]|nr:MAG: glycosyltransferase family 2 protein [Candidatus Aenigmarchaeota archaeon]
MKKISVIIPAYNEEKSIQGTINGIKNNIKDIKYEIIVINDGSTDRTLEIIKKIKGIKVISHSTNKGYGAAIKTGLRNSRYDWICIIDADGTYPAEDIPKLLGYIPEYDMVIGARTKKGAKIPLARKPAKFFLKKLSEYLTKTKIPDLNSGLRIFKREIAERFMNLFPDGFSFTTTLTIACLTNDYRVKFVPINYYEREGESSISAIRDFSGFLQLILRLTLYFNPLRVFIPVSLFLFLIGCVKIWIDFFNIGSFGLGGTILILTSIQLAFLGLIADMIIKRTQL